MQPNSNRNRRLVLYFDVNYTILMRDSVMHGNMNSTQLNVARVIARSAWGRVNPPVESDAAGLPTW